MRFFVTVGEPKEESPKKTIVHKIKHLMCNPPETWHKWMAEPHKIIEMEYGELEKAKEAQDMDMYCKELLHLAAACAFQAKIMRKKNESAAA